MPGIRNTHIHKQIHTEADASLSDGDDDDMTLGRSHTQMVDT